MTAAVSPKDQARDLEADLAICEAATPGPWFPNNCLLYTDRLVFGPEGPSRGAIAEATHYHDECKQNARFIAESREGWAYAIRRVIAAEAEIDRLRNELNILQQQVHGSEVYEP